MPNVALLFLRKLDPQGTGVTILSSELPGQRWWERSRRKATRPTEKTLRLAIPRTSKRSVAERDRPSDHRHTPVRPRFFGVPGTKVL